MGSPRPRVSAREQRRETRKKRRNDRPLREAAAEKDQAIRRKRVQARRQQVEPLNAAQRAYDNAIHTSALTFGIGPAGTGKTWWAATRAAQALSEGRIEKIIITRPAIEAGENLGFLPGELEEKYEPYFRPVRDALEETLGSGALEYFLKAGTIEVRPLAYLRGSTFKRAWILADEMQNTTPAQMKMFLTRIGEDCTVIVNGDPRQKDIPGPSGLIDAVKRLRGLKSVTMIEFTRADIVRSGLCQAIADRYESDCVPASDSYISSDDAGLRQTLRVA